MVAYPIRCWIADSLYHHIAWIRISMVQIIKPKARTNICNRCRIHYTTSTQFSYLHTRTWMGFCIVTLSSRAFPRIEDTSQLHHLHTTRHLSAFFIPYHMRLQLILWAMLTYTLTNFYCASSPTWYFSFVSHTMNRLSYSRASTIILMYYIHLIHRISSNDTIYCKWLMPQYCCIVYRLQIM